MTRTWTRAAFGLAFVGGACLHGASEPSAAAGTSPGGSGGRAGAAAGSAHAAQASLRQAFAPTGRHVGVALATWFFSDPRYLEVAARHFDSVTAENEMKWDAVEPEPGRFAFEAGDRLVAFAEAHRMRVRGHTLVWHHQLPSWVRTLPPAQLRTAMLHHVRTTVGHWKGRIAQWDVVNEAVDERGELRKESPFTALGPSYIGEAFRAAHEADPQARLFYNEYGFEAEGHPKTAGVFELVRRLKQEGVPIHGIGFQMHVDPRQWPGREELDRNLVRFAELGLLVEFTEIDVPVGEIPGSLEQKLLAQRQLTRDLVLACLRLPACTGITFWGLSDKHSWLSTPEWEPHRGRGPHLPLPFDHNYQPKPMYSGILEALAGR